MRNIILGLIMATLTTITAPVAAAPTAPAPITCEKVWEVAEKSAEALIEAKTPGAQAHISARLGRIWKREGARCALPPITSFIEGVRAARGERLLAEAEEEVQQLTDGLEALRGVFKTLDAAEAQEAATAKAEQEAEDRKAEAAVAAAKEAVAGEKRMGLMRECYSLTTCVAEAERLAAEVKKAEKPYDRLPILKAYLAVMAKLEVMLK